jgi:hypothetical protein
MRLIYMLTSLLPESLKNINRDIIVVTVSMVDNAAAVP